jgi:hypothetical protein
VKWVLWVEEVLRVEEVEWVLWVEEVLWVE